MEAMVEYLGKGFMIMLMISMPCVLVAALVGLVVGILQAVTSVQEQTIAAAPKIVLVFLTIIVLGGYFVKILSNYILEGTHIAFEIIPKKENYVLDSNYYKYTRPFNNEMQDGLNTNKPLNKNLIKGNIPWDKKTTKQQVYINSKQIPTQEPNFIEKIKIQQNSK